MYAGSLLIATVSGSTLHYVHKDRLVGSHLLTHIGVVASRPATRRERIGDRRSVEARPRGKRELCALALSIANILCPVPESPLFRQGSARSHALRAGPEFSRQGNWHTSWRTVYSCRRTIAPTSTPPKPADFPGVVNNAQRSYREGPDDAREVARPIVSSDERALRTPGGLRDLSWERGAIRA